MQFLRGLPLVFQPNQAEGLEATYHFTFTGAEEHTATVIIRDKTLAVTHGHHSQADLSITADSQTWVRFLDKKHSILRALLRRRIRFQGPLRLLKAFGKCFP